MKIVLDVNVLISALIKDSVSRKIIKESGFDFYFPEIAFKKIIKHKEYIIKKAQISEEEFVIVLSKLLGKVIIIPEENLKDYIKKSEEIMKDIDDEDAIFIASSLYLGDCIIWSDDSHFEKQKIVKILKTKDLIKSFS